MDLLKSFKHRFSLAWRLSWLDRLILVEAWWLLLVFYLALRWMSYERLTAPPRQPSKSTLASPTSLPLAQQLQRLVGYASRVHFIPVTCLTRSLTLQKILSRHNIPAQVCIGVNRTPAKFHAHAWVEVKGAVLGESQYVTGRFKMLNPP
jgi:hypothetical protein